MAKLVCKLLGIVFVLVGLAGFAAFCAMMAAIRWKPDAASAALGIFLIHGVVDVFLMTTPVYFAFWFLMGQAGRD